MFVLFYQPVLRDTLVWINNVADGERPKQIMRRGVLMNMLQQNATSLPLWIGKSGEKSVDAFV